jgi:hypothetical protein
MNTRLMLSLSAALLLSLGGCGDGDQGTPEGDAGGGSAMDAVKEQTQAAMDSAAKAGKQAMDAASQAAGVAADQGAALTEGAKAKAQELIDQVKTYLAENDLDSAEGIMDRLNAVKDSLP